MIQSCLNDDCNFEVLTPSVLLECSLCACQLHSEVQDMSGSWDCMEYVTDVKALQGLFEGFGYHLDSDFCAEIWGHHSRSMDAQWKGVEIESNA